MARQEPLTLTLSRKRERGPFGAGRKHGVSRHGLPPLPPGEGWGEGETLAPVFPGISKAVRMTPNAPCVIADKVRSYGSNLQHASNVGRITPKALSAMAADTPFLVMRPTNAAEQPASRTRKEFP